MSRRDNWLLDELATAGRENLDAAHVSRYDDKEDADTVRELAILQQFGMTRDSLVVDFGAGTGQFTIAAATAGMQVIAVDVSPLMLTRLRTKLGHSGLTNVDVVQSGFLTYEHHGRPADFVYSRFALHHLPDFWKAVALQRLRRILRPGGILRLWDVVYDFDPQDAEERIEAWCATGGSSAESEWSRDEFEEHVRDEHSTFRWLLEPMLERCGIAIAEAEFSPDGIFGKYIARAA